jgi:hypothetical protein
MSLYVGSLAPWTQAIGELGITEDLAVLGSIWMTFNHPIIMLILVLVFLAFLVWLAPTLFRMAKRGFSGAQRSIAWPERVASAKLTTRGLLTSTHHGR